MSCQVELIPVTEGNQVIVKEDEKLIVGRGSSLGCNDKKISRQHAELVLKKDGTLWIKSTHTNPLFYRPASGKRIQLTKDVEQELKEGDQIGLLPTSFFFRVSFAKDASTSKHSSTSPKDELDYDDGKSRKLPTWMSSTNGRSSVKRQLSEEMKAETTSKEPSKASDNKTTDKPSAPTTFDSVKVDNDDAVAPKKIKKTEKRRPACSYGASCYRKNAAHRTEQSHPGDSDYEDDNKDSSKDAEKKDKTDIDKPVCPYGKSCYRQNPQHKRDYQH